MKLSFRQVEKKDLELLRDWGNQKRVRKHSHGARMLNMVNQKDWFEKISRSKNDEIFMVLLNKRPIGLCGLSRINWKDRSAEVTYYLGKQTSPIKDVGIGLEVYDFLKKKAFETYNLNRFWGKAFSFNPGGVMLAIKSGFKKEGVMRQAVFHEGKYWDSIIVGMLAKEYRRDRSIETKR